MLARVAFVSIMVLLVIWIATADPRERTVKGWLYRLMGGK
jgi:hypothetical protein